MNSNDALRHKCWSQAPKAKGRLAHKKRIGTAPQDGQGWLTQLQLGMRSAAPRLEKPTIAQGAKKREGNRKGRRGTITKDPPATIANGAKR